MKTLEELKAVLIEELYSYGIGAMAEQQVTQIDFEIGEAPWHGYWVRLALDGQRLRVFSLEEGDIYDTFFPHAPEEQRYAGLTEMPLRDMAALVESLIAVSTGKEPGAPGARVMVPRSDED
jgi:hypothetical protein